MLVGGCKVTARKKFSGVRLNPLTDPPYMARHGFKCLLPYNKPDCETPSEESSRVQSQMKKKKIWHHYKNQINQGEKNMALPGFEPGSTGPQPVILTTRL